MACSSRSFVVAILAIVSIRLTASSSVPVEKDIFFVQYGSGNSLQEEGALDYSLSATSGRKVLEEESSKALEDNDNRSDNETKDDDENESYFDDSYQPHPNGTPVGFQDQDGTWMSGKIVGYDRDGKKYTVEWDENNMKEEYSDINQLNELVENADSPDEDENDYVNEKDSSDRYGEQIEDINEDNDLKNDEFDEQSDDKESVSPSSYQGTVPEDFDFGYTYKYDDLSEYDPWPTGTLTLLEFQDGYYEGTITSFELSEDNKVATYVVTWSDDTVDQFVNELEWMDLMVENAKEYEPWDINTTTWGYPNPKLTDDEQFGVITSFQNGRYTITWSNGDVLEYFDFDQIDHFVYDAGIQNGEPMIGTDYEPWPNGTPVSWDFDDGWWDGIITSFSDGNYEVTWSDKSTKIYSNLEKIDMMVQYAAMKNESAMFGPYHGNYGEDDDDYEYYPIGTLVYAEFEDGWWYGNIDAYDGDYYVVKWSDDTYDNFLPGPDVDQMVLNTQLLSFEQTGMYPVGTQVYSKFSKAWYWGTIEENAGGLYTILWEDGERTYHMSGPEVDEMVIYASNRGMSTVGIVSLIVFILICVAAMMLYVRQINRRKKANYVTQQVKESELDLDEENQLNDNGSQTTIDISDSQNTKDSTSPVKFM